MDNTKIKDRRSSIRYPIPLSIDLELENGATLSVNAINISLSGLQFHCDNWVANHIDPRGLHNHSLDHIAVKIFAKLPFMDENTLYANAHIMYAQRLSQEEYIIGVRFMDLEESSKKSLEQFFELHEQSK